MAFFWGNPINWLRSYRHLTAFIYDTTDQKREEWARRQAERLGSSEFSFKREDIPVFTHCGHGEFEARKGYGEYHSHPRWWQQYLEKHSTPGSPCR